MKYESASGLVEPYLDDELDAALKAQIEEHLTECKSCGERHAQLRNCVMLFERTPSTIMRRWRCEIAAGIRYRKLAVGSRVSRPAALAASILLATSLGWNLALLRRHTSEPDGIAQQVLASHIRSWIERT